MSITEKDVEKLAALARIEISAEEKATYAKEIDSILGYVNQLNSVSASVLQDAKVAPEHRNQLREDVSHTNTNSDPSVLVTMAPASEQGMVKVKKILN